MKYSVNTVFYLSLLLLGLGIVFIIAENSFYQYVDDTGILHESFFMPLGMLSILMGSYSFTLFPNTKNLAFVK